MYCAPGITLAARTNARSLGPGADLGMYPSSPYDDKERSRTGKSTRATITLPATVRVPNTEVPHYPTAFSLPIHSWVYEQHEMCHRKRPPARTVAWGPKRTSGESRPRWFFQDDVPAAQATRPTGGCHLSDVGVLIDIWQRSWRAKSRHLCLCRQQQLLAKHCTRLLQLFGSLRDLRVARGQSLKRSRGNTNKNGPLHGAGPGCTDERSLLAENPQTKRGSNEQQSQHSEKRNEGAGLGQFRRRCSRRRGRCYCDQDRDIRRRGWRRGRHFS